MFSNKRSLELIRDDSDIEGFSDDDLSECFANSLVNDPEWVPSSIPSEESSQTCRKWKQESFSSKDHDYPQRDPVPVRTPMSYFEDYFDDNFFEEAAECTNKYQICKSNQNFNTNAAELKKLVGIHFVMGCIPYPRVPMYWRQEIRLSLVADNISRDRFMELQVAFNVVDTKDPPKTENSLWKVQPVVDHVKNACIQINSQPGFYSIGEYKIPLTGTQPHRLRQNTETNTRPQELKVMVITTHEGLMIDFEFFQKSNFVDKRLGLGASAILRLAKNIPKGSCIYIDRKFLSIPLLEMLNEIGVHGTGMINRIPEIKQMDWMQDGQMQHGQSQQFVHENVAIVKWQGPKSVLVASNCTSADEKVTLERWDKQQSKLAEISCPKVVDNYNKHAGGINILRQSIEYYRTFVKTRNWTQKVIFHFFDLSISNAWKLYVLESTANRVPRNKIIDLLEFRMQVADGLINAPDRQRRESTSSEEEPLENQHSNKYRPHNPPSEARRYDGYDHLPIFDEIVNPRTCRREGCKSRSKIQCGKCKVYLCLSRRQNCFAAYHSKLEIEIVTV